MESLTGLERKLLRMIKIHFKEKGYPPSVRELQKEVHLNLNTVHRAVQGLVDKGYISKEPNKPRAIKVLPDEEILKQAQVALSRTDVIKSLDDDGWSKNLRLDMTETVRKIIRKVETS